MSYTRPAFVLALVILAAFGAVPAAQAAAPGVCKPSDCAFSGERAVVDAPSPRVGGYRLITAAGATRDYGANAKATVSKTKLSGPAGASAADAGPAGARARDRDREGAGVRLRPGGQAERHRRDDPRHRHGQRLLDRLQHRPGVRLR